MHVTVTITPQRVMVFFIMVAIWYCFIVNDDVDGHEADRLSLPDLFNNPAYPETHANIELKLSDHTQRILTSSVVSNNKAPWKFPPIPSVVGIGPEKCGTTSMAYMLTRHPNQIPELLKPVHEPTGIDSEMRVWLPCGNRDLKATLENVLRDGAPDRPRNYCSLGWYTHFWTPYHDDIRFLRYYMNSVNTSLDIDDILNENNGKYNAENPLSWKWRYYYYFEKSPAYWCYEHVAYLFHKLLVPQGTKFFVLTRDPVKRTYSYWSHQSQLGNWHGSWSTYITNALQNKQLQNMIVLLQDESKNILEIKDGLLEAWREYVYAESYGYIGRRDNRNKEKKQQNNRKMKERMKDMIGKRRKPLSVGDDEETVNVTRRRRLWSQREPGYVDADTNPRLGVGASCYVVPLLMWLEYVPPEQITVMQSELMYSDNHNNFLSDVRCWYSLGYEYDTMEECKRDGKKEVVVDEAHMIASSLGKVQKQDAERLYNGIFKFCNRRLKELLEMEQFRHIPLHTIAWELWYGS